MAQKEFRNPPRYMVGDIVYSHGFICVVCSIYPFNIDYSYDLKVIDGQSLGKICQNDIMHVHIWEEFLKKNGWKRDGGQYSFTFKPYTGVKVEYIGFFIEMFKNVHDMLKYKYFQIFLENKNIYGCFYVHQLQHLLFGLGLNSEMEV